MKGKGFIPRTIEEISHRIEKQKQRKQDIQKFWDMFDALDMSAKYKLQHKIDSWFDLSNGNITYDTYEDKKNVEKMVKILLSLPEKSTLHIYDLVKEKIKNQDNLTQALSMENKKYDTEYDEDQLEENEHAFGVGSEVYPEHK